MLTLLYFSFSRFHKDFIEFQRQLFMIYNLNMSHYYNRSRQDEQPTFGNGRYPKRSRREPNGYMRDYHSLSVSHLRSSQYLNSGSRGIDPNLYHYSLSSELHTRHSGSGHRYSTSSVASQQHNKRRHPPSYEEEGRRPKMPRQDSKHTSKVV